MRKCVIVDGVFWNREGSPSGLWRTPGKRVRRKPSRVRISYPPPKGDMKSIKVIPDNPKIPKRERWLYENPEALKSVRKGLKESVEGKTEPLDMKRLTKED